MEIDREDFSVRIGGVDSSNEIFGINDEASSAAFPKGIGQPAACAFVSAGYTRLQDLSGVSEAELTKSRGVVPRALRVRIIKQSLIEDGLAPIKPLAGRWRAKFWALAAEASADMPVVASTPRAFAEMEHEKHASEIVNAQIVNEIQRAKGQMRS